MDMKLLKKYKRIKKLQRQFFEIILSTEGFSRFDGLDRLKAERMAIDKLIDLYETNYCTIGNGSYSIASPTFMDTIDRLQQEKKIRINKLSK